MVRDKPDLSVNSNKDAIKRAVLKCILGLGIVLMFGGLAACQKKDASAPAPSPAVQAQEDEDTTDKNDTFLVPEYCG
ncbi:hypothetical protein [Anaerocolumna xylanovorans]|uniref:Uncharacterized protein n=1 Tax=Anaerocolumna xylanovorans DSM 12503 TaxID=1121345 RepID=A0A1M7YNP1_9FIRM|nr:hypothetical protein [Anaerocolumna xylanovorans]SHO54207.1 hypothetical protein SAMN02745217_04663 [Anaerocolumna xylanovorans DSM 12503]